MRYRTRRRLQALGGLVPEIDTVFIFIAIMTVLAGLAVIGTLLAGLYGIGPCAQIHGGCR